MEMNFSNPSQFCSQNQEHHESNFSPKDSWMPLENKKENTLNFTKIQVISNLTLLLEDNTQVGNTINLFKEYEGCGDICT